MKEHKDLSDSELAAGITLLDPLLFRLYFFGDELTVEPSLEQKLMFCDESERVLLCTGRKIAKTIHLEACVIQTGILWKSDGITEAMFFTPSDVHMIPFMDRVFGRLSRDSFLRSFIKVKRAGDSPLIDFVGGLRWYLRIEGLSGKDTNMVGLRAKFLIGDEMAFGNWVCHLSRLQSALPDAQWLYAGVPFGNRNSPFYALDQQSEGGNWSKHKYSTFINPIYHSEKSRQKLASDYGGVDTQSYKTQVLGEWGEEMISSFPPGSIAIRALPYFSTTLQPTRAEEDMANLPLRVAFPSIRCKQFAIGWDYGYSPDPAILVAAYRADDRDEWQLYCRITMRRMPLQHQLTVIQYLYGSVFSGEFIGLCGDFAEGIRELQGRDRDKAKLFLWANPGGATPIQVKPDDPNLADLYRSLTEEEKKKGMANIPNKELYTSFLRAWMVNATVALNGRRLWLAPDNELIDELVMTTERKSPLGRTLYYGKPDPNRHTSMLDHNRDALTYMCAAINLGTQQEGAEIDETELLSIMGWTGGSQAWKAPWENENKETYKGPDQSGQKGR